MQRRGADKPAPKKKRNPQPKQTGSVFGLPDVAHPFQGIGGPTSAPAKSSKTANLTEQVALARARKQRLQQGGLLSPAQRKAEEMAASVVATKTRFATPPPGGVLTPRQRQSEQRAVVANRPRLPHVAPKEDERVYFKPGAPHTRGVLGDLISAASTGAGTALSAASSIPGTLLTPIHPGATSTPSERVKPTTLPGATRDIALGLNRAAETVQGAGLDLPRMIPKGDLVGTAGAASKRDITPQALVAAGLSKQQTSAFRAMAKERGWNPAEIDPLVGLDLIKHAYSEPPSLPLRLGQNLAAGLIRTGGLVNLPAAAVSEIRSGHGARFAQQLGEAVTSELPLVGKHKFSDTLVADPYGASAILAGGVKTLGGVGGRVAQVGGRTLEDRVVTLAGTGGRAANRGPQSRNLYDASREAISDAAAKRLPVVGRRVAAKEIDEIVADAANQVAPPHYAVQKAEAEARKAVGQKRATAIMAAQMHGAVHADGTIDHARLEAVARDWEARAATDGAKSPAAGQARYFRETVIPELAHSNPQRNADFARAHAEMSAHTTSVMQERANFGDTAATYRRYQRPITMAARAGDELGNHVQAMRKLWRETEHSDPEFPAIQRGYDAAVEAFAERHAAQGGAEPVRVKYSQPANPHSFRHAGAYRQGFNLSPGRVHTSTGASAETGRYLIDPTSAQRENLSAQRLAQKITAAEMVRDRIGQQVAKGTPVPEDMVFVPSRNFNTAGKVLNDLHDNPVAVDNFEADHGFQASLHEALGRDVKRGGTGWTTDESGYLIPKAHWDRMHDYTQPETRNRYDRAMRSYQRLLIGTFPSTTLGNTLGTTPLGFIGGAGGLDYAGALKLRRAEGALPHTTAGSGIAGALTGDVRNPGVRYVNFMLRTSRKGEDITRQALYVHGMGGMKGMKKRALEQGFKSVEDYARAVSKGEADVALRNAALRHTIKFVGDMTRAEGKLGKNVGRAILFHRWVGHVATLMLKTLPVEHPRRLALINVLAQYGDQYRKEHGAWPAWMVTFAPLFAEAKGAQTFTKTVGLGQLAPQGTAGSIFDSLTQDQPWQSRVGRLLSPPLALAVNTGVTEAQNQGSRHPVDIPWYIASQGFYALPGASKLAPRQGQDLTSVPFIHDRQRYYAGPQGFPLPYDLRPGARPQHGVLGFASRAVGLPLYNVPNEGPVTAIQNAKAIQRSAKAYADRITRTHGA